MGFIRNSRQQINALPQLTMWRRGPRSSVISRARIFICCSVVRKTIGTSETTAAFVRRRLFRGRIPDGRDFLFLSRRAPTSLCRTFKEPEGDGVRLSMTRA